MKRIFTYAKQNKGSGIVTVMLAILFLSAFGTLALYTTYTSFQMSTAERYGKEITYNVNTCMDEVKAGVQGVVSDAISEAYKAVMPEYSKATGDISSLFSQLYLSSISSWYDKDYTIEGEEETPQSAKKLFATWNYNPDTDSGSGTYNSAILDHMVKEDRSTPSRPFTHSVTGTGLVDITPDAIILKDITVSFTASGQTSTITTDIKIGRPDVGYLLTSYSTSDIPYFNFICKGTLRQSEVSNVEIRGSSYAGNVDLTNNGTLSVNGTSDFIVGNRLSVSGSPADEPRFSTTAGASLWVGDIIMGQYGWMKLSGETYCADDLEFSGNSAKAHILGTYFGFGTSMTDYDKSSSIIFNAPDSKLYFKEGRNEADSLSLAGVSYIKNIGRLVEIGDTTTSPGVIMGESISAQKNQYSYFAPDGYVEVYKYKTAKAPDGNYYQLNKHDESDTYNHFVEFDSHNVPTVFHFVLEETGETGEGAVAVKEVIDEEYYPLVEEYKKDKDEVSAKTSVFRSAEFADIAYIKLRGESYEFNETTNKFELSAYSNEQVPGLDKRYTDYKCYLRPVYEPFGSNYIVYYLLGFKHPDSVYFNSSSDATEAVEYANEYFRDYFSAHQSEVIGWFNEYVSDYEWRDPPVKVTAGNIYDVVNHPNLSSPISVSGDDLLALRTEANFVAGQFNNLKRTLKNISVVNADSYESPFEYYIKTDVLDSLQENVPIAFYNGTKKTAIVVNGNYTYDGSDSDISIIIAKGNVTMESSFNGLVIAGGNIVVNDSAVFTPVPDDVVAAYNADNQIGDAKGDMIVTDFFSVDITEDYVNSESNVAQAWNISNLVTYEHWRR